MKKRRFISRLLLFICIGILIFLNTGLATANSFMRLQLEDPKVRTDHHDDTGKLGFLGTDPNTAIEIQTAMAAGLGPEDRAMAALGVYGPAFGLNDPTRELTVMRTRVNDRDRSSVRFQQVFNGVPILAGELIVNQDSQGRLISISGEISPDLSISTEPTFSSNDAKKGAVEAIAKYYDLSKNGLEATDPKLWILDERLLRPSARPATLVWRMEVSGTERLDIRELVLVDANFGAVVLHFNQIDTARNRNTYDAGNGTTLPGSLVCDESDPTCSGAGGDQHAIKAHVYAGDTYDFYAVNLGRDSIDNAGMTIVSTVHYGSGYANAFWNGSQMVYGDAYGFPLADDVVAHELTHGVTEYESHLFYFYESGAINETFSDLYGELVDQTNGGGNDDPSVKWLVGEDVSGLGAIRDMADPPAFGLPDRINSGYYHCATSDNGGVHYNMGVGSKAAFLLTDGGSFNGYVVTGLGITKVADLFYETQTNLLTSGSNFNDFYNALIQASYNLGFSAAERQEVQDAVNATEMDQRPCGNPTEATVCSAGFVPSNLFFDDLENTGSGNWVSAADTGPNEWYYPQNTNPYGFDATNTSSGIYNFWAYDIETTADFNIAMTSDVTLPANAYMHFKHYWDFEYAYDGGVVEYSTTGGSSWVDAGSLFTNVGYNGTISSSYDNPIGGREGFVYEGYGYTASKINLNSLAGQNVRFRFRIGTDYTGWDYGWFIDDIRIYTCREEGAVPGDFDGDGDTDITVYHWHATYGQQWYIKNQGTWSWGNETSIPVPADYDGDGDTDIAVYDNGTWYIKDQAVYYWGDADSIAVPGDYDGDGDADVAVFDLHPSWGQLWYIKDGPTHSWGNADSLPVPADYDGDGVTDVAVYNDGMWYIKDIGVYGWGNAASIPVPGDYNGDGAAELAVYVVESGTGTWYIQGLATTWWGGPDSIPVPGDYNGDGITDIAIFNNGTWYVKDVLTDTWGGAGDYPLPAPDYDGDGDPY
jgi:bacillolysin